MTVSRLNTSIPPLTVRPYRRFRAGSKCFEPARKPGLTATIAQAFIMLSEAAAQRSSITNRSIGKRAIPLLCRYGPGMHMRTDLETKKRFFSRCMIYLFSRHSGCTARNNAARPLASAIHQLISRFIPRYACISAEKSERLPCARCTGQNDTLPLCRPKSESATCPRCLCRPWLL